MSRANPFQPYYDMCNSPTSSDKYNNLPEFPRYIDVELTNTCNFKCFFCATGTGQQTRPCGFMDEKIYDKLIGEVYKHKTPLRFIRWGEPLLHKKAINFIAKAHDNGLLTHLTTNGSLLKKNTTKVLIDIPLDSIKFSFQGIDRETYREMRNKDFFNELLKKIEKLHIMRGDRSKPYVHVSTTITYEPSHLVEKFKNTIKNITDSYQIGRTVLEHIDAKKTNLNEKDSTVFAKLKKLESVRKARSQCPQVFDVLSVNYDGSISACCRDYDNFMVVGDLRKGTIKDAWESKKMQAYRKLLLDMKHDQLPLCKTCYDMNQKRIKNVQELE